MILLYTLIAWAANACILLIFHISTQQGQILGFWGDKLLDLERKEYRFLSKAGGLCEFCYAHWFSMLLSPVYFFMMHYLGYSAEWYIYIIWFLVYHSIATVSTLWILKNI
jgi:hypothetical protein